MTVCRGHQLRIVKLGFGIGPTSVSTCVTLDSFHFVRLSHGIDGESQMQGARQSAVSVSPA